MPVSYLPAGFVGRIPDAASHIVTLLGCIRNKNTGSQLKPTWQSISPTARRKTSLKNHRSTRVRGICQVQLGLLQVSLAGSQATWRPAALALVRVRVWGKVPGNSKWYAAPSTCQQWMFGWGLTRTVSLLRRIAHGRSRGELGFAIDHRNAAFRAYVAASLCIATSTSSTM